MSIAEAAPAAPAAATAAQRVPGLALVAAVAAAAPLLGWATPFPPVLAALLMGFLLFPVAEHPYVQPGLEVAVRPVLRLGVGLLGAQISLQQMHGVGPAVLAVALGSLCGTLGLGYWIARRLRLSMELACLTTAAVAICGASAALAVAAVLPRTRSLERSSAACVAGITIIGTMGMLAFPLVAAALELEPRAAGAFVGASLHEVVHAVGAGFSISDEAGAVATTVKLVRVACLGPIVLLISLMARRGGRRADGDRPPLMPWFLILFVSLAGLASWSAIPAVMLPALAEAARFCLLMGIAALGAKVSFRRLAAFGWTPSVVLVLQSIVIAGLSLGAVLLLKIA